jgi:hypothetical protein
MEAAASEDELEAQKAAAKTTTVQAFGNPTVTAVLR